VHAVTVLADWAAIAIGQARLYRRAVERSAELERALEGLEATTAIARVLGSETDLARVLELIVKRGRVLVRARTLVLLLRDGDRLVTAASAATAVATAQSVEAGRLRHSLRSAEQERSRWARELHDETLQGLALMGVMLSSGLKAGGETLERAARQANEQLSTEVANLRALITELRPAALDQAGLVAALEGLARRSREVDGLEVTLDLVVDEDALDPELKTATYRLVQEALSNVSKHARADRAEVGVTYDGDELRLRVKDDGCGFVAAGPTTGFGLVGMRDRVALLGGEMEVATSDQGTLVTARIPAP
jgi:signal transduction histidine kinase